MIPKEDIRALISVNNDQLALVMDEEKEAELHGVIGKVREIILHLPDSSIVLQMHGRRHEDSQGQDAGVQEGEIQGGRGQSERGSATGPRRIHTLL